MSHDAYQASVNVTIDQITPLYDWLLVRRLHEEEYSGLIIPPGMVQGRGGQWVRKTDSGPRRGEVVATGEGERNFWLKCDKCDRGQGRVEGQGSLLCECGGRLKSRTYTAKAGVMQERVPMAVGPGDIILYPRFESSHVNIGGETLTFVHEGDVMAVLDAE